MADKDYSEDEPIESVFCSQQMFSQVLGGEIPIPGPVEPTPRIYYPTFDENKLLLMVQPRNFLISNIQHGTDAFPDVRSLQECHYGEGSFANQPLSRRLDENIHIGHEQNPRGMEDFHQDVQRSMYQAQNPKGKLPIRGKDTRPRCGFVSVRDDGMEKLTAGRYGESFKCNVLSSGRDENIRQRKESSSSGPAPLNECLLGKNVVDVAKQLLSVSDENNPHAEDSDAASDFSPSDISIEYLKLYTERSFVNYDFSMNLMAYIELLNDSSWNSTVSYFDEKMKRMVEHIWNEKTVSFTDTIDLKRFNREMALKLMHDFTQWSINRNFELEEFLNYCVLICQLGVIVRKTIYKESPLHAIGFLRYRIKILQFENFAQFLLGIALKDRAKRLVEHSMM